MSNISTKIILTNPLFFLPPSHHQGKRRFPTPFATAGTPFLSVKKGVKEPPNWANLAFAKIPFVNFAGGILAPLGLPACAPLGPARPQLIGGLRLTTHRYTVARQRSSRKRPRTPHAEKSWVIG